MAILDKMEPKEGEPALTQSQLVALPLLAAGAKKKEAAAAAGVCAQTVSDWLRAPHFAAALQDKRDELNALASARLAELSDAAVTTVRNLLTGGAEATRLKAAIFVLERMILLRPVAPPDIADDRNADLTQDQADFRNLIRKLRDTWKRDE